MVDTTAEYLAVTMVAMMVVLMVEKMVAVMAVH